jgi:hypothetical protein
LEAALNALDRLILPDDQRARISPHIIGDERTRGLPLERAVEKPE